LELQLKMRVSAAAAVWSAWLGFEKRNHTSSYSRKYNPTSAIKFLATLRSSWLVIPTHD
jgi:phage gp37-like protein